MEGCGGAGWPRFLKVNLFVIPKRGRTGVDALGGAGEVYESIP